MCHGLPTDTSEDDCLESVLAHPQFQCRRRAGNRSPMSQAVLPTHTSVPSHKASPATARAALLPGYQGPRSMPSAALRAACDLAVCDNGSCHGEGAEHLFSLCCLSQPCHTAINNQKLEKTLEAGSAMMGAGGHHLCQYFSSPFTPPCSPQVPGKTENTQGMWPHL